MKFRAHDTFFIRRGWLHKGMKYVHETPSVFLGRDGVNPMDVLGIGANMVKSLRYWLQAVGLTTEDVPGRRREQTFTALGELIWEHDPFFEEIGTLWLLHYRLASNHKDATAWWWFFNDFRLNEFSRDDFVGQIDRAMRMWPDRERDIPLRSIEDDFDCIIRTYLPRVKSNPERVDPESNIDCPLGELGLIDIADRSKKTFRKLPPAKGALPPFILLAALVEQAKGAKEIRIADIQNASGYAGKIFNLDIITLIGMLYQLEQMKCLKVVRTAGLDVVRLLNDLDFNACVTKYYGGLGK